MKVAWSEELSIHSCFWEGNTVKLAMLLIMGNRKCSHTLALPFTHLSYLQAVNRGGRQLSQKLLRPWLSPLRELWASWLVTHVSKPTPARAPRNQLSTSCSNQESPCLNGQARAACKNLFEALERETEQQGSHTHMHMGSLLSGILRGWLFTGVMGRYTPNRMGKTFSFPASHLCCWGSEG